MTLFGEEAARLLESLRDLVSPGAGTVDDAALGLDGDRPPRTERRREPRGRPRLDADDVRSIIAPELERLARRGQLEEIGKKAVGGGRRDG